jgi:hypothetical protein
MLGYNEIDESEILDGLSVITLERKGERAYAVTLFGDQHRAVFADERLAICAGVAEWVEMKIRAVGDAAEIVLRRYECSK